MEGRRHPVRASTALTGEVSALLNDARLRAIVYQLLAMAAVIAFITFIFANAFDNMARRGIASGFGFLGSTAGFGVTMSLIEYSEESSFGRAFVVGLLNTLLVSAIGVVLATAIGFAVGIARLSQNWLVAHLATVYVETLRNIPLLLQLFFWYFAVLRALPAPRGSLDLAGVVYLNNRGLYLPAPVDGALLFWMLAGLAAILALAVRLARRRGAGPILQWGLAAGLTGVGLAALVAAIPWQAPVLRGFNFTGGVVLIPEFVALVLALAVYTAAFIAEIVRAGILSVSRGQTEAAVALGLDRGQTLRLVVMPQALRVIVPPLTNQYLNLTKNSSLAAAIAYPDLVSVFGGTVLNITGQAVEVISVTMAVYLFLSLAISLAMNLYNRRIMLAGEAA